LQLVFCVTWNYPKILKIKAKEGQQQALTQFKTGKKTSGSTDSFTSNT
jgi:hypothetical protein